MGVNQRDSFSNVLGPPTKSGTALAVQDGLPGLLIDNVIVSFRQVGLTIVCSKKTELKKDNASLVIDEAVTGKSHAKKTGYPRMISDKGRGQ